MTTLATILALCAALALTACVQAPLPATQARDHAAAASLKAANAKGLPTDQRALLYLTAAEATYPRASDTSISPVYNQAVADLTVLLRSADHGQWWNHPLTVTSGTTAYRLGFAKGTHDGNWDPEYFTTIAPATAAHNPDIRHNNTHDGIGGTLVGIHRKNPLEPFSPLIGVTSPATAVVDFHGHDATLTLANPNKKSQIMVAGHQRPLAGDFTAPLAYYPHKSEFWNGLMGAIRVDAYMKTTGLYMLQPYDPARIPLIFVHGLISTPRMWRNVINEIEADPTLRGRYQCWVFSYPTGNPPIYSALRLREELARLEDLHPDVKKYVIVGHSMGGLLARMQASTTTRESYHVLGSKRATRFFTDVKKGSLIERCVLFQANPRVGRIIFICTPHRGSAMAVGSLGDLAMRLISLPVDLTSVAVGPLGNSIAAMTGDPRRLPNSVTGLAPSNPMLKVLDDCPIQAPYHTIVGDRGKGDTPQSSDGVVNYWSSHLGKAQSECIVPGPHGSCELPQTLDELRRLLHLHLKQTTQTDR